MRLIAMDTAFSEDADGTYSFDRRCELVAQAGYEGMLATWFLYDNRGEDILPLLAGVRERHGIDLTAVWLGISVGSDFDDGYHAKQLAVLDHVPPGTQVELAIHGGAGITPSDPAQDDRALRHLAPWLAAAERRGTSIVLYPHVGSWIERIEDAVRLCARVQSPWLKAAFCAFHWRAVDGKDLRGRISAAAPWLASANVSGAIRQADGAWAVGRCDDGRGIDIGACLSHLHQVGYRGALAVQAWGLGGDPAETLEANHHAVSRALARL